MSLSKTEQLLKAAHAYYVLNSPIMSDLEYDLLFKEVQELEKDQTYKITDKVCLGYFEGKSPVNIKHKYPMLSVKNDNDRVPNEETICTPKYDGASLEVVYENGKLIHKLTRGDGTYGADVTKIITPNIPTEIDFDGELIVRGEILCPEYLKWGKSHRNICSGTMALKNPEDRGLVFIAYWSSLYSDIHSYEYELLYLQNLGFVIPVYSKGHNTGISLPQTTFKTDGYVLRVNDNSKYGEHNSHHYKNIWAYKPQNELVNSTILDVEWTISKNGTYTPVALIAPVELQESTISRVNLMSIKYTIDNNIAIGDIVAIRKAKEIIPEIATVIERPNDRQRIFIDKCLKCGDDLVFEGIYLKCKNPACSIVKRLEFFCKTLKVTGMGEVNCEKINVSHPLQLFILSEREFENALGKVGKTIYQQLHNKTWSVIDIIVALNPPRVKRVMLEKMLTKCEKIEDLTIRSRMVKIKGLGNIVVDGFIKWYKEEFEIFIPVLHELDFDFTIPDYSVKKVVALSGTLPMTRDEFVKLMEQRRIKVKNSVTKDCALLITGDRYSESKFEKAIQYNIPTVSYTQFMKSLQEK